MIALIKIVRLTAGPVFGLVLGALLLAGCVPTSENPIVSKSGANDPALLGTWRGKMDDDETLFMHVLAGKAGAVTALLVSGKSGGDSGWASFRIVTAEVKGTHYISALWLLDDGKPVEEGEKGYHLMRYEIRPDGSLQMFAVDEDKLKQAVKDGKVGGKTEGEGASGDVRLTASSEKLEKFLKRIDPAELFDKPFATLSKL